LRIESDSTRYLLLENISDTFATLRVSMRFLLENVSAHNAAGLFDRTPFVKIMFAPKSFMTPQHEDNPVYE
jgi:hypothetical protein